MSEAWNQWQGQLIDGRFHLQEYLGGNGESAVFRTQLPADPGQTYLPDAYSSDARWRFGSKPLAIKLIADSPNAELQLSRWRMAQDIAHPNLLRILDTGRCRRGEIDLIFAVMEYADENLAQIIEERPLSVQEAREVLGPLLDALAYLHRRGLVHGHLKPANIMAANDVLKLSTDGVCPADEPIPSASCVTGDDSFDSPSATAYGAAKSDVSHSSQAVSLLTEADSPNYAQKLAQPSPYAAPETAFGAWTPATDVWSLGVTLAEVLTQHLPSPVGNFHEQSSCDARESKADPLLPKGVPAEFLEIVRGCIRHDLRLRWTFPAIQARLNEKVAAETFVAAPIVPPPQQEEGPQSPDHAAVARDGVEAPSPAITLVAAQARVAQPPSAVSPEPAAVARHLVEVPAPASFSALQETVVEKAKIVLAASRELLKHAAALFASTWAKTSRTLSPAAPRMTANAISAVRRLWVRATSLAPRSGAVDSLLRHFALPAVIASAALVAIYAGMSLRRPPTSQAKPAPVITAQPLPAPGTRRLSPASRTSKPNAGQPGQVQPVSAQQPASRSIAEPQVEARQPALSSAQPGIRRIDDGGADDNAPATPGNSPVADARSEVPVTQRVLPHASSPALATIHGTVRVNVRVQVDQSGNVSRADFASPGPSKYFARLSLEAAQDWKFAPRNPGPILLRFEFTRGGVEAYAFR